MLGMLQTPIGKLDVARLNVITSGEGGSSPCKCKGKTCTCASEAGTVEVKAETQLAFLADGKPLATVPTGIPATLAEIIENTVNDNIRLKPLFPVDGAHAGELGTVPDCVCDVCDPLLRVTFRKDGCKVCKTPLRNAETPFADKAIVISKKNKELDAVKHNAAARNRITNERLFCKGETATDPFSRTIALRYLAKRMVFARRSNSKGSGRQLADAAGLLASTEHGPTLPSGARPLGKEKPTRKGSSATHDAKVSSNSKHYKQAKASAFCAGDVEDVINEAWLIFKTGESVGMDGSTWKLTLTGNRLHDTCNACRMAIQRWQRETYKQTVDLVHYARYEDKLRDDGDMNVILRSEDVQRMIDVIRIEGHTEQATIAKYLGVSQQAISKRFAQLRRRILNERS